MTDFIGYAAGVFLMMSYVPQVIKSARTKKTADIAWGMLLFTLLSSACYEIYALMLKLTPVIIMNGIFLATVIIQAYIKYRFDKNTMWRS